MRRVAAITLLAIGLATLTLLISGGAARGSSSSTIDVIFDDARGLVAGQDFKIAGAQAGTIEGVVVTPDFKARVQASVEVASCRFTGTRLALSGPRA